MQAGAGRPDRKTNKPEGGKRKRSMLRELSGHVEIRKALGCGVVMAAAWGLVQADFELGAAALYVFAYLLGGWDKARDGIRKLFSERELDVNLLMVAAALGAAAIGYWNEGALLIFIFALSGALESFASDRSGKDISELIALRPEHALKIENGSVRRVEAGEIKAGDRILVPPGAAIAADGRVTSGRSFVDQSSITGESVPIDRAPGDDVYAGTINGEGELRLEVTRDAADTLFAKMIRMVEQAREDSPPSQRFVERFESVYVKVVLVATSLLILVGPWLWDGSWKTAFYKGMVFLVVASPCAIVASVMPPVLSAMSGAARRGVLFKGGASVDRLAGVKVAAFDKTGTLTMGEPELSELVLVPGADRGETLRAAASVERHSSHPLAQAIVRAAESEGINLQETEEAEERAGFGVEARIGGVRWSVGRLPGEPDETPQGENDLAENYGGRADGASLPGPSSAREAASPSPWWKAEAERLHEAGMTVSFVLRDGATVALLALSDRVRPEARRAVQGLQALGIEVAMLTGDRGGAARRAAEAAGVKLVFAELLPQDKVDRIRELRERYGSVLMIGDGVNDAPAMATADVGMAMGVRGSGAALGTADVVLMQDDLLRTVGTIRLARRAEGVIRQNLTFAVSVVLLLMATSLTLGIALPLGVVGHEGSTLLVILNGLRLLRSKKSFHEIFI
ncbi:heavy metal translocating P-type ATPase [Saccharibacillus sp. O23]|nr:heavy metal translocating P-type ATPase [Saccharibacillus sp. O23]